MLNNKAGGHNISRTFTYNGRKWALGGPKQPLCPLVKLINSLQQVGLCGPWPLGDKPCPLALPQGDSNSLVAPSPLVQCLRLHVASLCCNHSRGFILDLCVIQPFNNTTAPTHIWRRKKTKKQETAVVCMRVCVWEVLERRRRSRGGFVVKVRELQLLGFVLTKAASTVLGSWPCLYLILYFCKVGESKIKILTISRSEFGKMLWMFQ